MKPRIHARDCPYVHRALNGIKHVFNLEVLAQSLLLASTFKERQKGLA